MTAYRYIMPGRHADQSIEAYKRIVRMALYDPGHYVISSPSGYPSAEHAKSAILRFMHQLIPAHAVRRWYTMSDPVIHFRNGSTIAWRGVEEFATTKHGKEAYDERLMEDKE